MSKFEFKSPGVQTREIDQSVIAEESPEMGPIIIGRTKRGPASIPVSINSLDDFNDVFGKPVPGMSSDDVWRNGINGPTYASYAAQSWLASETTPINMVRLLGEGHPQASAAAGKAGWDVDGQAYGLWIMNSADNDAVLTSLTTHTGTLAAVFYTSEGSVSLSGSRAGDSGQDVGSISLDQGNGLNTGDQFVISDGTNPAVTFTAVVGAGSVTTATAVDFSRAGTEENNISALSAGIAAHASAFPASALNLTATINSADAKVLDLLGPSAGGSSVAYTASGISRATVSQFANEGVQTESELGDVVRPVGDDYEYTVVIRDGNKNGSSSTTISETITFNFNRNSEKYIRNVFNTNPTLTNNTITPTDSRKTYWLGETFERNLKKIVSGSTSALNIGTMLQLASGSAPVNWHDHKENFKYARTGYFISQDFSAATTGTAHANYSHTAATTEKLFRCVALGGGQADNTNFMIAIKDLKLPTDSTVNPYGSFTLNVVSLSGNILESFTELNFNPTSDNFILRRIGDQFLEWNEDLRKYEVNAETQYLNNSSYIRIEMFGGQESLPSRQNALPFGFLGPVRPAGFDLLAATTVPASRIWTQALYQNGHGSSTTINHDQPDFFKATLEFPEISLRISGSDGLNSKPAQAYFGFQPTITANSRTIDSDTIDYARRLPVDSYDVDGTGVLATGGAFEYSCVFSLDDIVLNAAGTSQWYYFKGTRVAGTSYSATSGSAALLDAGVNRFYAPMIGGFDGFDITQQEPLGNHLLDSTSTDLTSYVRYTLHKALAAVEDPEVVPANLLLVPGQQEAVITDQVVATATDRQDLLAIIDLKEDYQPATEATASARGSVTSALSTFNNRTNINSSYGCAFYPAVQVADTDNGQFVWVPSSVAALGAFAQSQKAAELWFAPAGFNRGGLGALGGPRGPVVIQARQRLDSSQRDDLYDVNINPIASFPNEGVVIFGQKTLQRTKSALDRINVRRLMIFLKKEISDLAKLFLFEQNNDSTRGALRLQINGVLTAVQSRFGLSEFQVILDSRNNSADDIDNNRLNVSIFVKPTRAIEFIAIDFIITRSGVEFAE